jgi:hypothetical protein
VWIKDDPISRAFRLIEERRIIHWHPYRRGVMGTILSSDGATRYDVRLGLDGTRCCGCPAFQFGQTDSCIHTMALTIHATYHSPTSVRGLTMKPPEAPHGYVRTAIEPLNDLTGGLPTGTLYGITGPYGCGKSTLVLQLAFDTIRSTGASALIVDSENGRKTAEAWWPRLASRYGVRPPLVFVRTARDAKSGTWSLVADREVPEDGPVLYIADVRTARKMLAIHGRGILIDISEKKTRRKGDKDDGGPLKGGKFHLRPVPREWTEEVWDAPMGHFVREHGIGFLAYDSITNPMAEFGLEHENLPARNQATSYVMIRAQDLASEMDLVGIVVTHETKDPANVYDSPKPTGGVAVGYNTKYTVRMLKRRGRGDSPTTNWLKVQRHPALLDDNEGNACTVRLTMMGFVGEGEPDPTPLEVPEHAREAP